LGAKGRIRSMTDFVTGASGFIGCWLTAALAKEGRPVIAQMRSAPSRLFVDLGLDRHPSIHVVVESNIAKAVAGNASPEMLYHLAGMSQIGIALKHPIVAYEANARQTWELLDSLRSLGRPPKTVIASTDSIYGETGNRAATEDDAMTATGPYETSKMMADLAARSFAAIFGLPVAIARLGNTFGYGDENSARIVPSVMSALQSGVPPHLRGGGRAVRSLLYVDDCIRALRLLAENADADGVKGEAFNVAGDTPLTTLEIARMVLDAFGRADIEPQISDGAPGETSVKYSSSAKLRARLGWEPRLTLAAGLARIRAETDARGA
jgi:CDP-glucose 4,6-dehydratase